MSKLRDFVLPILMVVFVIGLMAVPTDAKPLSKSGEKQFIVKHSRLVLVPKITGGILVGDAADALKLLADNFSAKFLYGAGLSAEIYLTRRFAASIDFEMTYKDVPGSNLKPIKGFSTGFGAVFKLVPNRKGSLYFKGNFGRIKITLRNYFPSSVFLPTDFDIGTFDFFRIGIGITNYTNARSSLRSEFYYKQISTDGGQFPLSNTIGFNTGYIGIEIAWGISILPFK